MKTVSSLIADKWPLMRRIVVPLEIEAILSALSVPDDPGDPGYPKQIAGDGTVWIGKVGLTSALNKAPIPGFGLSIALPDTGVKQTPFKLKLSDAQFQFWLVLGEQGQVLPIFDVIRGLPGFALTGAEMKTEGGHAFLKALADGDPKAKPRLVSRGGEVGDTLAPALLFLGSVAKPVSIRLTPDTNSTEGVVAFGLEPPAVLFGSSGLGFHCPELVIDDSETAKASGNGVPTIDPPKAHIDADDPPWRGLLARQIDVYLPKDVPLFGEQPIKGYLAVPFGRGGAQLIVDTNVPAKASTATTAARPEIKVRIECIDPTAEGLAGLVPTLVTLSMELPLDQAKASFSDGTAREVTFAAGRPVVATATFARDPVNDPDKMKLVIAVSSQGKDGLLSVESHAMGAAKIFNTCAALATALIADKDIERKAKVGATDGVVLYGLLAAGSALTSLFTDDSRFVLHGIEIESSGSGAPVGGPIAAVIDYSVAVRVTELKLGPVSVSMKRDQPMRIRVRKARMSIDPTKSGLEMIGLDYDKATLELENPGAWSVQGLQSLFEVLRSRSGRGSSWIEVDLGFKLNLGPIRVSGATIRATMGNDPIPTVSIRGLDASLTMTGAFEGRGTLQLLSAPDGFSAYLRAKILPLNVAADVSVTLRESMVVLALNVDLPAPIPLANSGFGLMGLGGLAGLSAQPDYSSIDESDPVLKLLKWDPRPPGSFKPGDGSTFGLSAAVGTLPDLGFAFSSRAALLLTVPDIAVRGSLNGRVLQPPAKLSDPSYPPSPGISFLGFVGVDSKAVDFAILGSVDLRPLLLVRVPVTGHFPREGDRSDWYIHLGADGAPIQGRSGGPISAVVLPGILDVRADAYVMMRGKGILAWPHARASASNQINISDGFVVAFGFGFQSVFGYKPIVWVSLHASLDLLIATKPQTLAGFGHASGSLNLGPFSLGVEAKVTFLAREDEKRFFAEVRGKIELLFFDIEGTVTIAFGTEPKLTLPVPDRHPLDLFDENGTRVGSLGTVTDDSYRTVATLAEHPDAITEAMHVWPDAILSLPFAIAPSMGPNAGKQFPGVAGPGAMPASNGLGSEMLRYHWRLDRVKLVDVTDEADKFNGAGVDVGGHLAARWQVPRGTAGQGDVTELLLGTTRADLWVNRLADGGKGMTPPPLDQAANICRARVWAEFGWAVGVLAQDQSASFRLPPDPVSLNPLNSRVEAFVQHEGIWGRGQTVDLGRIGSALPHPYSLSYAERVTWPSPVDIKRDFTGYLVMPCLHLGANLAGGERTGFTSQRFRITLTQSIHEGLVVVIPDPDQPERRGDVPALIVRDDTTAQWVLAGDTRLPTGEVAAVYHAPHASAVHSLWIDIPVGASLGLVGVGGITTAASAAAQAENAALTAEATRQANAANNGPKTNPSPNTPEHRTILEPGRLYRLDVDMQWSGQIARQVESGQIVVVEKLDFDDPSGRTNLYQPKGAGETSTRRQLFFRTTKKPSAHATVAHGMLGFRDWLWKRQDTFQPEMLERHFGGYEPAQGESNRFCDDPLRAHFRQDHVAALAKSYGFDLAVAVRRVDRPGNDYSTPKVLIPIWAFATDRAFLHEVDQIRYDLAITSPCVVPKPGATASLLHALEPQALYELHVVARKAGTATISGQLPGVTFTTSRWRGPQDMLAGLGFAAPSSVVSGDLSVDLVPPLGSFTTGTDQAFQSALDLLGLRKWPVALEPRLSRIWSLDADAGWVFAGLMIESPEPIHRPGRFHVAGLRLTSVQPGPFPRIDLASIDRTGTRLLYLASAPFAPVAGDSPRLVLSGTSISAGALTTISGSVALPAEPAFAGDP